MYTRHKFDENQKKLHSIRDEDLVSSRKWDGGNYFMSFNNAGNPSFVSRRESVKGGYPDKTTKVPHLASISAPEFAGHVFNVELIHTGHEPHGNESHSVVSGILNSLSPKAIETQKNLGPVRAIIHDLVEPHINTFGEKIVLMKKLEESVDKPDILRAAQFKIGRKAFDQLVKETKEQGQEGVIATSLTKPESENPRIKIKHKKTANLRIKDITQEFDKNGKPKESAGAAIVEEANGREVAAVGMGWTREQRKQMWQNKRSWIGRIIQVEYQDVAERRLRSPSYNGDADGDVDKFEDL